MLVESADSKRRCWTWLAVVGSLAACVTCTAQTVDTSHVPQRAIAAAVIHPARMVRAPELELVPWEVIQAAVKKELGVDPLAIEQALALAAAPNGPAPPDWGLILRFVQPQQLAEQLNEDTEEAMVAGTAYRRGRGPGQPSFRLIDGRTLLVGSEPMLRDMITAADESTPLRQTLATIPPANDVTAVLAFSPIRDMVKQQLAQAPPLPPPLQPLLQVPDQLDAVLLALNFSRSRTSGIKLVAVDAAAAEQLEATLQQSLAVAKQLLLGQAMQSMRGQDDEIERASVRYLTRVANSIENRLRPTRRGNELLITVNADFATSGVLVALLLPAVQSAREAARRTQSANNLKMIGVAMHNFHDAHRCFPPAATADADGRPLLSWRVQLLPFLEAGNLYEQFHLDEPWDSEHNRKLIERMPAVYRSPNLPAGDFKTVYLAVTGQGTAFSGKEGTRLADIRDGTSNSILAVEANADRAVIWTKPEDLPFDPQRPLAGLGELRPNGFQSLFADGSVRFIARTIDPTALRALMTIAGGEPVPTGAF